MAYTDDCLGRFVSRLKKTPAWKNLLIICIADHGIGYPKGLSEADMHRYHIPMLWIGGAVKQPKLFTKLCNQTDLPATLLGQLGINHKNYPFSRDVTSHTYTYPFAILTFDNGFAFIDSTGYTVQDFNSGHILTDKPKPSKQRFNLGHAILQTTINDLGKR
jgi:phosphoglycerol transferase MdoB-like AlkP superfamily enzyme